MDQRKSFVMIGAGNVAFHLAGALTAAGFKPLQIAGRSTAPTRELSGLLDSPYTTSLNEINPTADFYIIAVNDDAIPEVLERIPVTDRMIFHTSGSTGMGVFGKKFDRYGIFYPLQTFSKVRALDFHMIPVFIEGSDPGTTKDMRDIAEKISRHVYDTDAGQLLQIHLAAVFACNFTNHMFTIAEDILKAKSLPFDLLKPLIEETILKLSSGPPAGLQTGPAVRGDTGILQKHIKALESHPDYQKIYTFISQNIQDVHQKNSRNG